MVTHSDLARACRSWGRMLWLPPAIDGPQLLWALSGCESSFGANCAPRHEPYYHQIALEKKNAQLVKLTELFGCDAHSSFGPWQELLVNCSETMKPEDFSNLNRAALEVVRHINRRILEPQKPTTVAEIATAYNSGKWHWTKLKPGVQRYAEECVKYYEAAAVEMPTA